MDCEPTYEQREGAARARLTLRHGGDTYRRLNEHTAERGYTAVASAIDAFRMVIGALENVAASPGEHQPVTAEDVDDALTLVARARRTLDHDEMLLLDTARAHGRTWQEIGATTEDGGAREAERRFRELRDRFPGYRPVSDPARPAEHRDGGR